MFSIRDFQSYAQALDALTTKLSGSEGVDPARLSKVNDSLQRIERAFLIPSGLPGRPWFKHSVYAPGLTTGYASWPLPGVRQAVLDNDPEMLKEQLPLLVARIDAAAKALRTAADLATAALPAPHAAAAAADAEAAAPKVKTAGAESTKGAPPASTTTPARTVEEKPAPAPAPARDTPKR